jgi:hypothetical protein
MDPADSDAAHLYDTIRGGPPQVDGDGSDYEDCLPPPPDTLRESLEDRAGAYGYTPSGANGRQAGDTHPDWDQMVRHQCSNVVDTELQQDYTCSATYQQGYDT